MGHDGRFEKVRFLLLKKRFYLGLFILLPAFFCLFAIGGFLLDERWAYAFGMVALIAGVAVAYSLIKPAKRLIREHTANVEEFGSLGGEFRDIAISFGHYIAAVENLTGGVITTDRAGTVTMANRQALEILGSGLKTPILGSGLKTPILGSGLKTPILGSGRTELPFTNIKDGFLLGDRLNAVLEGAVITTEADAMTADGLRLMGCTISPIRGLHGVEGAVLNFRDISRLRELHAEFEKAGRLASIGSLTMTVAHEVRNPLASIKGIAQLIAEDMKDDDPKHLYIETILKEADRLNRVVDSLYEIRDSTFEAETLRQMLHRIKNLCDHAIKGKTVRVVEHMDETSDSYEVKDERVFHGIYNILLNAYEAVVPGGMVILKAGPLNGRTCVEVVSESELKEGILERLFVEDVTTKGPCRGAGLKIARSAMRQAGGDIEAVAMAGKTVFRIWLT